MPNEPGGLRERSEAQSAPRVVIVTGYSGSGKSTVVHALEDLGFFCIDNLPIPLLPKVVELASSGASRSIGAVAFVVDIRERDFLDQADRIIEQLHAEGARVDVVFLEADEETLLRRYSATRRPHPAASDGGTIREAIAREGALLAVLRTHADWILDTSNETPHTLKALVKERFGDETQQFRITLLTFGFKYGLPAESDLVFDVRFLANPYFVEEMREHTGLDEDVRAYVLGQDETGGFLGLFRQVADFLLPLYEREGKAYLTIGIGCTGGRHRSVAVAEAIAVRLRGRGWHVTVRHRDVEK